MDQNAGSAAGHTSGNGGETAEFKALLTKSVEELRAKTIAHQAAWRFGKATRWSLDMSQGDLLFEFDNGVMAICPSQIIGSLDSEGGTWLWAWANPSIPDSLKRDSLRVREFGEQRRIARLTSEEWPCTEEEAWQMAALACMLCGAQGVYRGPAGTAFVFISFGAVNVIKNTNA